METRTITQVKVYKLLLNPMVDRCEATTIVALAYDKDKLMQWYESLKVEPYRDDDRWNKNFKKDSDLEWYNPLEWSSPNGGVKEEWTTQEAVNGYIDYCKNSFGFVKVPKLVE